MAPKDPADPAGGGRRPQDPLVSRLRPDPDKPAAPVLTMVGFRGESDRDGFGRLYFTRELDYYAEFHTEDVVDSAPIPPDQQPFAGEEATRVTIRRDAGVRFTRERAARPLDEFDLDLQFGRRAGHHFGPELISDDSCAIGCPIYPPNEGAPTGWWCPTDHGWTCYPEGCPARR